MKNNPKSAQEAELSNNQMKDNLKLYERGWSNDRMKDNCLSAWDAEVTIKWKTILKGREMLKL